MNQAEKAEVELFLSRIKDKKRRNTVIRPNFKLKKTNFTIFVVPIIVTFIIGAYVNYTNAFWALGYSLSNSIATYAATYEVNVKRMLKELRLGKIAILTRVLLLISNICLCIALCYASKNIYGWIIGGVAIMSTIGFFTILISIVKRPIRIRNTLLTYAGTLFYLCFYVSLPFILIQNAYFNSLIGYCIFSIFSVLSVVYIISAIHQFVSQDSYLNIVQFSALGIIPSDELKKILFVDKESINKEKDIIQFLLKRKESTEYSTEIFFIQKEGNKKISRLTFFSVLSTIAIAMISFTMQSLGDGIIQDLWKQPIENILCNYLNILCDTKK